MRSGITAEKEADVVDAVVGRISELAQSIFKLKGEALGYEGQEYFLNGIDDTYYNTIFFKTGRQVGKSTNLAIRQIIPSLILPSYKTLYVSPSFKQTKEFSQDKIDPLLNDSPWVQANRVSRFTRKGIETKTYTNGSRNTFRYAFYTADRCRGISADLLLIDEIQDILWDNVPVIEQVLSHSIPPRGKPEWSDFYKKKIYSGTPKSMQNPIEYTWEKSTQCMWMVPCYSCGQYSTLDNERVIGKHGTICMKTDCRKPIDPRHGFWHAMQPKANILGFHISQLMAPRKEWGPFGWIDWNNDILDFFDRFGKIRFYNEVLGVSCDDATRPVTQGDIMLCCTGKPFAEAPTAATRGLTLWAGIDWGESNARTVLTIGGRYPGEERFTPVFVKVYKHEESADPNFLISDILKWLRAFNVSAVGCDVGHGFGMNGQLMKELGVDRVFPLRYVGPNGPRMAPSKKVGKYEWQVNRTQVMSEFFMDIKKQRWQFPSWELFKNLAKDILAVQAEYSQLKRQIIYIHNPDEPDDLVHSLIYCRLAAELGMGFYVDDDNDDDYR